MNEINVISATIKKDFLIALSYRFNFIVSIISSFFFLFIFFNFSQLTSGSDYLGEYSENTFAYYVIGIAVLDLAMTMSSRGANSIRGMQSNGTFEELFIFNKKPLIIIVSVFAYPLFYSLFRIFLLLSIGTIFFELQISKEFNLLVLLITYLLSIFSFVGIGMISASLIIILKRGDFINSLNLFLSVGIGGVLFPAQMLNDFIVYISNFLPITHILGIFRAELIGANEAEYLSNLYALASISILLIILGLSSSIIAIKFCKNNGSLGHY